MQVQLAKKVDDKFKGFDYPLYSRKFDGKRMYVMDGVAYSRDNKPCRVDPIKHIIEQLPYKDKAIYDGEVIYFDDNIDYIEDFKKTISLTSSIERKPGCDKLYYVIFDIIPKRDLEKGKLAEFYREYICLREALVGYEVINNTGLIQTPYRHILLAYQTKNQDDLTDSKNFNKWEGLMVRNGMAPYEFKRTGNLRKIKKFQDGEFEIIDYYSGTGKYENMLGGIVIDYKGNSVCVGSGFTDEQREEYLNGHEVDWLIGKKAKVKYFQESCDDKGNPSLRFPIFQCLRDEDDNEYV